MSIARSVLFLMLCVVAVACGDRAHLWESPLDISGPYKAAGRVMWVDGTRGLVFALDPAIPTVTSVSIPRNASYAAPTPTGKELLVLTAGKEAVYTGQQAEEPTLTVVGTSSGGELQITQYPLPAAFDRLAVSDDGKLAVAFYSSSKTAADVFRNPNEVALFDLGQPPGAGNPVLRTVRSFGSAPLGVAFSPEMAIPAQGGAKHTLAVVLAVNYLTFLDMKHTDRREITVPLAQPDASAMVQPQEVLFSAATSTVFVRADGASDVYAIGLLPKQPTEPGENDFIPMINQPSAGKLVRDMVLFSDGGKDQILTANASGDLALIDAATSQFDIIQVGEAVDTIVAVPASKPTLALIYSASNPTARIHFLELADLDKNLEKNLTSRSLALPVHQLVTMPSDAQALVVHNDSRTVVSVLDLVGEHHTVSPIQGQVSLASFDFASDTHLVGVSPKLSRLGILDLSNLLATSLRLDHVPRQVLTAGDSIVVTHTAKEGLVTVVPAPQATREECTVLWGFLFQGLLDHEIED